MKSKLLAIALAAVTTVSVAEAKETVKIQKPAKAVTKSNVSKTGNMYLRADLGYGFGNFKIKNDNFDKRANGTILSGAFGSKVADNVRAEIQLYHNLGTEAKQSVTNGKKKFEQKTTALMVNAYYDFNNSSIFTPYVMAGAGVAHNKMKGSEPNLIHKSKGSNNLALQTGAGVATKIADNMFFDVRYNLMNKGVDYKFSSGKKLDTGLEHSAMAGIRVHF